MKLWKKIFTILMAPFLLGLVIINAATSLLLLILFINKEQK